MNAHEGWRRTVGGVQVSLVGAAATALVAVGLLLGTTAHMGFMALVAAGAFGPGVLRQFGVLDDLDEFQKEAAAKSALRAYLTCGVVLMTIVVAENWNRLSLGAEKIPASSVVALMLIVYYASYCLSFWDTRKAVSRLLLAVGLLWVGFVVLSHASEPGALLGEALVVPGPFLVGAIFCRWWPRTVGVLLVVLAAWTAYFFNVVRFDAEAARVVIDNTFVGMLVSLPLATAGVALVADGYKKAEGAAE
jgi:hypothetical protein